MTLKEINDKIMDNWPAKIICLTLSVLLFLFYRMSTLEQRYFSVPLLVETNGDLVPATAYPRMVKISLRGEVNNIFPILEDDIVAFIDLSTNTKEGDVHVAVQTRIKGTALDVDPLEVSVDPLEISLRVEHRVVKKVQVTPSFKGYPEAGFEFSGYTLNPSIVELSGPRSAVEKISDIVTDSIELSGRNAGFVGTIPLVIKNSLVSLSGDSRIQYAVNINQTTLVKSYEKISIPISRSRRTRYRDPFSSRGLRPISPTGSCLRMR
jgi:YbbR domain-containing protein